MNGKGGLSAAAFFQGSVFHCLWYCVGVVPVTFLKVFWKWLCEENER